MEELRVGVTLNSHLNVIALPPVGKFFMESYVQIINGNRTEQSLVGGERATFLEEIQGVNKNAKVAFALGSRPPGFGPAST